MTRINVVPVQELVRQHLVAEYREIARLPQNLRRSLSRSTPFSKSEIPTEYTLGKGHVKFFYDKMLFLKNRFDLLTAEMQRRGYKTSFTDSSIFVTDIAEEWCNDYTPTESALEVNRSRISLRLSEMKQD